MANKRIEQAAVLAAARYDNPLDEPCYDKHYYDGFIDGATHALSHQWTPMRELQPANDSRVLAADMDDYGTGRFRVYHCWYYNGVLRDMERDIVRPMTHWMPVPEFGPGE